MHAAGYAFALYKIGFGRDCRFLSDSALVKNKRSPVGCRYSRNRYRLCRHCLQCIDCIRYCRREEFATRRCRHQYHNPFVYGDSSAVFYRGLYHRPHNTQTDIISPCCRRSKIKTIQKADCTKGIIFRPSKTKTYCLTAVMKIFAYSYKKQAIWWSVPFVPFCSNSGWQFLQRSIRFGQRS